MTGYVTAADGCRIAYRLDGPAGAPVLVLSNSLGTRWDMWAPQVPDLVHAFRVLRYDSRGHGRSGAPDGDYALDRLGTDVLDLLDALGLDRVRFAGLSMGGMVGLWLAIRAPHRLERLALCNTAASLGPPEAWQARIDLVRAEGMASVADHVLARWFTPAFRSAWPGLVANARAMLLDTSPAGYAGCCAAIRDMDQRPGLPGIRLPTLVVGGSEDPATPPDRSVELAACIPGARLEMLPAAHLSNIEQAGRFTTALMEFMA